MDVSKRKSADEQAAQYTNTATPRESLLIMSDSVVAPVLSSTQDESDLFQKYAKHDQDRTYLNPHYSTEYLTDPSSLITDIKRYYSLDKLAAHLNDKGYSRVTLQFPDSLVADSPIVAELLERALTSKENLHTSDHTQAKNVEGSCKKSCDTCSCSEEDKLEKLIKKEAKGQKVWILADTAYSSCCIDSVAAEHVHADVVVHFGDACINSIDKLPAVYVFGEPVLDIDDVIEKFHETYGEDKLQSIVLMADATHSRYLRELWERLSGEYENLGYLDINIDKATNNATIIDHQSETNSEMINAEVQISNRQLVTQSFDLKQLESSDELQSNSTHLFHITKPEAPHLLYLTAKFSTVSLYDPSEKSTSQGPFPSLSKRYRFMHMARTVGTIGILVNTLSLSQTTKMINLLSKQIKEYGKKPHFFVVGKPNVAKLANFESVECWCVVGCAQGGIILDETNEFYRPIITPFELGCALGEGWTGGWEVEFKKYLEQYGDDEDPEEVPKNGDLKQDEQQKEEQEEKEEEQEEEEYSEDEAPEFDPVTGKYVSAVTSKPLRQLHHLTIEASPEPEENSTQSSDSNALVKKLSSVVAIRTTVSTSAQYLQTREWTGLGSDYKNDESYDEEGALVEEGLESGVARGYGFDVSDMKTKN
ncbi:hypothetical protein WICPIJ_006363 [Wickerhamomyces pijperi]|uniref:2-(3-amino-3-carboxypropyl)histidine synthase subunit 2 n=1 Tax=Wickerhamomyces pijperi TaxID=599730 RepID=A0A9P8TL18_WICPI|nr:hypothetical protein WICPIJ_006363 [Wickerhamomyces pijperi]